MLAIGVGCWFAARHQRTKANQLRAGQTYRCSDIGETLVGQLCEVSGEAQPGPEGAVTGPQTGREGVWFAHKVTRHWWETRPDDGDRDHRRERVHKTQVVRQSSSDAPFVVNDGSGSVAIAFGDFNMTGIPGLQKDEERGGPPEGYERGGVLGTLGRLDDHGEYFEYEEWVMPAGTRLFVSGEVGLFGDALGIGQPKQGQFVISTKSEQELIGSAERNERLLEIATIAAGVIGLALIVVGLVA